MKEMKVEDRHYSMRIQYSDATQGYVVKVPELPGCQAEGHTYEEAAENALVAIEKWIEAAQKAGEPVPPPSFMTYEDTDFSFFDDIDDSDYDDEADEDTSSEAKKDA